MKNKVNYGIDGPSSIRTLMVISIIASLGYVFQINLNIGALHFSHFLFLGIAVVSYISVFGCIMYGLFGKFKHRERIINAYKWRGDEKVLDVGSGLGLLAIAAAKKLTSGKAIGIDIWHTPDLSNLSLDNANQNAFIEGVAQKVEFQSQNIMKTDFADNSFDVVVSNLCLHNIYNKSSRAQACKEIVRIVKPGGTVILSDYKNNIQIADVLLNEGLLQKTKHTYYWDVFPPLTIQKFIKPN